MALDDKKVAELRLRGIEFDKPQSLESSYARCAKLLELYIDKYDELEEIVQNNTTKVEENTRKVEVIEVKMDTLIDATKGLISAWTTANNVQKFIKWISGIGLLGIVITWVISKLPANWLS